MQISLKKEIQSIVSTLMDSGKIGLAKKIEENWHKTCLIYSKEINSYQTDQPMEKIMKEALSMELFRLGHSKKDALEIVKYLEKHRVLQTAPHLSPAGKPRFFFINWLASVSLTKKDFYPVAMFSGVPFSNKTRPGRLCSTDGDINLMPSNMQDALAYRSVISEKMIGAIQNLPAEIKKILPKAKVGDSYTKWALLSSQKIEGKYLHGKPVFFDFNEVVTNYILLAIKDKNHPISKILFSKKENQKTALLFENEVFFYGPAEKGKYEVMESFALKGGVLESPSRKIILDAKTLTREIKENRLATGLPLGFLIFSFLNHFLCLGSFAQVEYLPVYREKFNKISCLKKYKINKAPAGGLTTGGFPENLNLCPFDLCLGVKWNPNPDMLFGETIVAIKDVLLRQNYSSNMIK